MPDPHWENLKDMFHAALALAPDERAAYLEQAAQGDPFLRRAVESLLSSHEQPDNFVDAPAYQAAAELLVDGVDLKTGENIAHYRIMSLPHGEALVCLIGIEPDHLLRSVESPSGVCFFAKALFNPRLYHLTKIRPSLSFGEPLQIFHEAGRQAEGRWSLVVGARHYFIEILRLHSMIFGFGLFLLSLR